VITYASKGLFVIQQKFHPMEGEYYALVWGVMHFRQFLHQNHFTLRTNHKPLEWLAMVCLMLMVGKGVR
jgi:hypothetical protein